MFNEEISRPLYCDIDSFTSLLCIVEEMVFKYQSVS